MDDIKFYFVEVETFSGDPFVLRSFFTFSEKEIEEHILKLKKDLYKRISKRSVTLSIKDAVQLLIENNRDLLNILMSDHKYLDERK